jgi:hypothetical protein
MMDKKKKGFSYILNKDQIEEYRSWPLERRLQWLYFANKLRRDLPKKIIEIQEAFRQGRV